MLAPCTKAIFRGGLAPIYVKLLRQSPFLELLNLKYEIRTKAQKIRNAYYSAKGLTDGDDPGFIEFVHNLQARGKRLLGALIGLLVAPPRGPS